MTTGEEESPDPAARADLTQAVKSAILDRLLRDLGPEASVLSPRSVYTKSDSGLYGKYEKSDGDQILALIHQTLDSVLAEYEARPPAVSDDVRRHEPPAESRE